VCLNFELEIVRYCLMSDETLPIGLDHGEKEWKERKTVNMLKKRNWILKPSVMTMFDIHILI
jgi:hypothetical protein